jgi:hypothetical protein
MMTHAEDAGRGDRLDATIIEPLREVRGLVFALAERLPIGPERARAVEICRRIDVIIARGS